MRKKLTLALSSLALAALVLFLWPTDGYDINGVDPILNGLASPYQTVSAAIFLDGGSIGITIVDRKGQKVELALPVSTNDNTKYPRLFIGGTLTATRAQWRWHSPTTHGKC